MRAPAKVLVVVTRRIGDVLLATPLIRSLRQAWPQARIDALVFRGTDGVLAANRDLDGLLTIAERPRIGEQLMLASRLLRRYDIALSLLPSDRPTFYAWLAGRRRFGLQMPGREYRWKQRLLSAWTAFDNDNTHTVRMHLALADLLGIEKSSDVVVSWRADDDRAVSALLAEAPFGGGYAVLHVHPKFNYKKWHAAGWRELADWIGSRGFGIVLTGGPDPQEVSYVNELAAALAVPAVNLAGRLTLGQTGALLSRARLFVGPDTSVTHMAAALGVPTVALFGPSNPVKWGPWPKGFPPDRNPWTRTGSQHAGNVFLVQGNGRSCVPCLEEGCERHIGSYSECLQQLPAAAVIAAAGQVLPGAKAS